MALPVEFERVRKKRHAPPSVWYFERSERAAAAFQREIESAVAQIGDVPTTYPIVEGELRRFLPDRFPYALLYALGPADVRVVAVAHLHRRPGYWRST